MTTTEANNTPLDVEGMENETLCVSCERPFADGDRYYLDFGGGFIHADCCGGKEGFCTAEGDPLQEDDPMPAPRVWVTEDAGQ